MHSTRMRTIVQGDARVTGCLHALERPQASPGASRVFRNLRRLGKAL